MSTNYEAAVLALYHGAPEAFVSERKRLAAELKAAGSKDGAKRLSKLQRPTVSVWLVNQLYARERALFERLFATAEALRNGDLKQSGTHRETLTALRQRAIALLEEAGRPTQDAIIRRVMTSLSALAANGDFAPDLPGALTSDREPLGFGVAMTLTGASASDSAAESGVAASASASSDVPHPSSTATDDGAPDAERDQRREAERELEQPRERELERQREHRLEEERAAKEAERNRVAARRAAERTRLETEATDATAAVREHESNVARQQSELERLEGELSRRRAELERAESDLENARQTAASAAERLAKFDTPSND